MQMKENESIESIKSLGDKKDASHDKKMDDTVPGKEAKNEGVAATEMEREVLLKIISASPLMSRLSIQIQKELVSNLRKERAFNKGDSIIDQGGTANCLYILEQGECEVFKTVSEEEGAKKVNVVEPGTCFGELGLLHDCPRAASVICSSDDGAVVWSLDRSIFRKLVMFAGASERVD
jgi:cAMP-dependent protein kinase regulator